MGFRKIKGFVCLLSSCLLLVTPAANAQEDTNGGQDRDLPTSTANDTTTLVRWLNDFSGCDATKAGENQNKTVLNACQFDNDKQFTQARLYGNLTVLCDFKEHVFENCTRVYATNPCVKRSMVKYLYSVLTQPYFDGLFSAVYSESKEYSLKNQHLPVKVLTGCELGELVEYLVSVGRCFRWRAGETTTNQNNKPKDAFCKLRPIFDQCTSNIPKGSCLNDVAKKNVTILLKQMSKLLKVECDNYNDFHEKLPKAGICPENEGETTKMVTNCYKNKAATKSLADYEAELFSNFPFEDEKSCKNVTTYVKCMRGIYDSCKSPWGSTFRLTTKTLMNATPNCKDNAAPALNSMGFPQLIIASIGTALTWVMNSRIL